MDKKKWMLLILGLFLFAGCAPQDQSIREMDYEQTKKMVVDILKTDDGKKAIKDVLTDEKMQQQLIMDQAVVTDAIEKTLTSEKGAEFWKKTFEDPKFAETFAKSMQSEQKKLMKALMKDPEYQGMMMDILKDPETEKNMMTLLKSKEYKEHLQKVMTDTFDSPLFKAKIQNILLKAAEEMQGTKKQEQGGQSSTGQSDQDK